MSEPRVIDVVKRRGHRPSERFDPRKLHSSIRAACLSVRSPEGEAETTAHTVVQAVIIWCADKPVITSRDIHRLTSTHLQRYHPEAAYIYQHHRTII